jgi:hypothetical protein
MNNCETDIGAAQDLPEWAVFTVDSGRSELNRRVWGGVPGPPLQPRLQCDRAFGA